MPTNEECAMCKRFGLCPIGCDGYGNMDSIVDSEPSVCIWYDADEDINESQERKQEMTNAMPEGLIWPQFEDGTLVNIGDEVKHTTGSKIKVSRISYDKDGYWLVANSKPNADICVKKNGQSFERPLDDSWEKLEEDAKKGIGGYWNCMGIMCRECCIKNGMTPAMFYDCDYCDDAVGLDIIARAKKIAEHERNQR